MRVGYNAGSTVQEIDSKIFKELPLASPFYTENSSAGTTGYAALAASFPGNLVTTGANAGDDSGALLALPFSFPFAGGASNQIFMSIDGYLAPGAAQPTSQYGLATGGGVRGIFAYTSDYTTVAFNSSATLANIYFYSDATQAIFRWEVAESGQSTVIAKFAVILKPDGSIRYVYSDLVTPPSAGTGGPGSYAEMAYGVQLGYFGAGVIHYPTGSYPTSADFSNHADILYTPTGAALPVESVRAVFRLQQPIPAGGTSSGQYTVYYGAISPPSTAAREVRNIFDTTVDFRSAANVVGQAAPDWDVQVGNTISVQNYQGGKIGALNTVVASNHPRATVKASAMPSFLNPEILAHVAPNGSGALEMAPMARVVSDSADPNFQGGYAYGVDAYGDPGGSHILSYVNPVTSADPADMGGVPDPQKADVYCNILYRVTGSPGIIQGKNWRDDQIEPAGLALQVDRAQMHPAHAGIEDPIYNQPGTTGMSGYAQKIAIDYIALRELRNLAATVAASATLTPSGPFIQGTITNNATGAPLPSAIVTISNGGTFTQTYVLSATGTYKVSLAAGTYSVSVSAPCYETQTKTGVAPTASAATNFVMVFGCGTLTGVCRESIYGQLQANTNVTLSDGSGMYVASTTSDANGFYSLTYPSGGAFTVAAMSPLGYGARVPITLPSGGTAIQNFTMTVLPNGDCETPNPTNSFALGWTISFDAPSAYIYTQAQNHTPGGHWSMGITDPSSPPGQSANNLSGLNNPPAISFALPVHSDLFDITVSAWVYFTKSGQNVAMRLRDNFPLTGGQNRIFAKAGSPPDANNQNTGGLDGSGNVPVNQWYEIRGFCPAGNILKNNAGELQMNLYAMNSAATTAYPGFSGGNDGTVYFDDWTITQTIKASATGRLVDQTGTPVANGIVGVLLDQGFGSPNSLNKTVTTDATGHYNIYRPAPETVVMSALQLPTPDATGKVPALGYYARAEGNATAGTPGVLPDMVLTPKVNVPMTVVSVVDIDAVNRAGTNPGYAVDNNLNTRQVTPGGNADVIYTFDLGSPKQIDQIEVLWEFAYPADCTIGVSPDIIGNYIPIYDGISPLPLTTGVLPGVLNYSSATEGTSYVFNFAAPQTVRYIQIENRQYQGGLGNYSLIELRALSSSGTVPFTRLDVIRALQIAGGIAKATAAEKTRLAVTGGPSVQLQDAAKILRSLSGL